MPRGSLMAWGICGLVLGACASGKGTDDDDDDSWSGSSYGDNGGVDTGRWWSDSGLLEFGYAGSAEVSEDSYDGLEHSYYVGEGGNLDCVVTSTMSSATKLDSCKDCEWAFAVESSASFHSSDLGCDLLSGTDASSYDGWTYHYGYHSYFPDGGDELYGVLLYQADGYGWYAVTAADFTGGTFSYDWSWGYYRYYF